MLTLYQFSSCPFCWKVKALLHLASVSYDIVEVTPFGKKELDFTEHKKVPVLRDGEKVITESNEIAHYIQAHYTSLPMATSEQQRWLNWVDDTLVHYLPPLVHPTMATSFKNFAYILPPGQFGVVKGFFVRLAGAFVMPRVAQKMMKKYDIQQADTEFNAALQHWVNEGLAGKAFQAGDAAGLVDAMVYGVLRASAPMPFFQAVLKQHPELDVWYQACDAVMRGQ